MNTHYHMTIAGCERDLPICPLNDKLSIGAFVIFGDCELTEACATELLKKAPEFDYLITAESKGIPLVYEMARQCGCKELPAGVEILNATEVVEICDDPATAAPYVRWAFCKRPAVLRDAVDRLRRAFG